MCYDEYDDMSLMERALVKSKTGERLSWDEYHELYGESKAELLRED